MNFSVKLIILDGVGISGTAWQENRLLLQWLTDFGRMDCHCCTLCIRGTCADNRSHGSGNENIDFMKQRKSNK